MSYGERLKYPGNRGRTPQDRESWKEALNQADGNLRYMLGYLKPEELVKRMARVHVQQLRDDMSSLEEYEDRLKQLYKYHETEKEEVADELGRLQAAREEHADYHCREHELIGGGKDE